MLDELNNLLYNITSDKIGVEIGGPSIQTGGVIYNNCKSIDNVVFSKLTIWNDSSDEIFPYGKLKNGKNIINDAIDIQSIQDNTYDFCFSSHCLEHIANPLKAIKEYLRIIKKHGYLIIIVPEKSTCFDHNRNYTSFSTILNQYNKNIGEDDLSTLPEILKNHDLSMDPAAGNFEQFTRRSLDNVNNRCLHHYVYSIDLLDQINNFFNCESIYSFTNNYDIYYIFKKV